MKFLSRHVLWGLGLSMLLAACGGGGGGGDDGGGTGSLNRPTARVTASAATASAGDTVTFDGSASTPANGSTLTYQWKVTERPAGSTAALATPTAATSSFTPDLPGSYSISLGVSDAVTSSNEVSVKLEVRNPNPVAVTLPELAQLVNTTVQLDGTASQPPAGGSAADLRFNWTLVEKPDGSKAELDNPHLSQPRFLPDVVGLYRATLVVTHGSKSSQPVTVRINANQMHTAPVAMAGSNIDNAVRGQRVQLDGSASTHAQGSSLQYRWFFAPAGRPWGSQAVIEGSNTARPTLVPDFAGTYRLTLVVYDGTTTAFSGIQIKVKKPDGAPNTKPVAVISRPFGKSFEAELGTSIVPIGAYSQDKDEDTLTREWTLVSAPAGFDAASKFNPTWGNFTGTHYGNYVVQLRVNDGKEWSDPVTQSFTVLNGANRPPVAKAAVMGGATAIGVGTTVTLTGEASTDPDNNRMSYAWTLLDKPDGSTAKLSNAAAMNPSFVADKPGPYSFSLIVTDEHGTPSSDGVSTLDTQLSLNVKTKNNTPIARLAADVLYTQEQPLVIGKTGRELRFGDSPDAAEIWNSFLFNGNGYDPDGDMLTYLWTLSREPAGSKLQVPENIYMCGNTGSNQWPGATVSTFANWIQNSLALRQWTCPDRIGIAPTVAGAYELQLAISDGMAFAGPFAMTLHAVERQNYPSLLLEYLGAPTISGTLGEQSHPNRLPQQLFPYASVQSPSFPIWQHELTGGVSMAVQRYRLTAYGGDYTIADLAATSAQSGYALSFQGLNNGQVIRKGETVEFSLRMQVPSPVPAAADLNKASEGMQWSFRIAEKSGWTFSHKPFIFPY